MESPDIVIEEDYISKPSPAKKPNLGNGQQGKEIIGGLKEKETEPIKKTNGIEMESEGEEMEEENLPPVPTVQVKRCHNTCSENPLLTFCVILGFVF